jgi:transposase
LVVDSQTLWGQLNALARHLASTYEALGSRALGAPVTNLDETRWAIVGSAKPAAGTVWACAPRSCRSIESSREIRQ